MAIVSWPDNARLPSSLLCVICKQDRPPAEVSAGLCDADGNQAFACNKHFWFGSQFITGWATFAIEQRRRMLQKGGNLLFSENGNGWLLR